MILFIIDAHDAGCRTLGEDECLRADHFSLYRAVAHGLAEKLQTFATLAALIEWADDNIEAELCEPGTEIACYDAIRDELERLGWKMSGSDGIVMMHDSLKKVLH